jgi:hypothetical protein
MQPSTIQKLRSIFNDTESGEKVVVQDFKEFVDLIPLPEGVKPCIQPTQMNNKDSLLYKVSLTWKPKERRPPIVTELFTFSVTLGTGCPFRATCFNDFVWNEREETEFFTFPVTQETDPKGCLRPGDLMKLAQEVKARLNGQIALWEAGKLSRCVVSAPSCS